jgi:hypothetical protein
MTAQEAQDRKARPIQHPMTLEEVREHFRGRLAHYRHSVEVWGARPVSEDRDMNYWRAVGAVEVYRTALITLDNVPDSK